jgi:hypothetical protein
VRPSLSDRAPATIACPSTVESRASHAWALALSISLVLIVCIRFFSEDLGVIPRLAQYVDVPITITIAFAAILGFVRRGYRTGMSRFGVIVYLFILISLLSAWLNSSRVETYPLVLFIYNFVAPLIFLIAIVQVRLNREDIQLIVRTFFWIGFAQVLVAISFDLPRFLATHNPDYMSGTFGFNQYQFTYFIGLWFLYVLGGWVLSPKPRSHARGVAMGVATVAVFGLFYAAQYRAMLIFFTLVVLAVLWLSPVRISSRFFLTIVISAISVISLIVISTAFPNLKLLKVFDLFQDTTPIVQSGKVQAAKNVVRMYEDIPLTAVVGSGPATFSSRAYLVFAETPRPEKEAAGALVVGARGGVLYTTDVATRYVTTIRFTPIQGGSTLSVPMSSYTSLAAEVGPGGFLVYMIAYLTALGFAFRRLRSASEDPLHTRLAFACFGGLVLLLVQALFDNWLDTTRVAIPLWILVGLLYALQYSAEPAQGSASGAMLVEGDG